VTAKDAAAPALPFADVIIGRERDILHRERLVRVQRVDRLIRLLAAVRVDATTIRPLGTFTIPVMKVAELQRALARVATGRNGHPPRWSSK